jgi:hypothetical protein
MNLTHLENELEKIDKELNCLVACRQSEYERSLALEVYAIHKRIKRLTNDVRLMKQKEGL